MDNQIKRARLRVFGSSCTLLQFNKLDIHWTAFEVKCEDLHSELRTDKISHIPTLLVMSMDEVKRALVSIKWENYQRNQRPADRFDSQIDE